MKKSVEWSAIVGFIVYRKCARLQEYLIRHLGNRRSVISMTGTRRKKKKPDQRTFAYEYYVLKQRRERTPMVLKLVNGEEVSGRITWYDQYVVKLEREPEAPNLVVKKRTMLCYYKAEAKGES
jgi:RNA chaperone Hfq